MRSNLVYDVPIVAVNCRTCHKRRLQNLPVFSIRPTFTGIMPEFITVEAPNLTFVTLCLRFGFGID